MRSCFMRELLQGRVGISDIEEYIRQWHELPEDETISFVEFLGMTPEQYNWWFEGEELEPMERV